MKRLFSVVACMTVVLSGNAALANEHWLHGHHGSKKPHSDQGSHQAKGHHKFDDHDRELTHVWCVENRERLPIGFRAVDRLSPAHESLLRVGAVLDVDLRKQIHPIPVDLLNRLPAPPVGVRYIAIGGHVGLLDGANILHDLLPLPPMPF